MQNCVCYIHDVQFITRWGWISFFLLVIMCSALPASLATASTSWCLISAMYPSTVKMTKPDKKLVRQFTELVTNASLTTKERKNNKLGDGLWQISSMNQDWRLVMPWFQLYRHHETYGEGDKKTWSSISLLHTNKRLYVSLKKFSLVAVVVKWIVARKGEEHTKAWTQREEDLSCCIYPNLREYRRMFIENDGKQAFFLKQRCLKEDAILHQMAYCSA